MFLTQVFDISLTPTDMAILITTTVGASIGSPASPGVGIVILATILAGVGVPPGGIALIIGVDRILDMCRTSVNVAGDLAACRLIEKWLAKPPAAVPTKNCVQGRREPAGPARGP